jgi:Putative Flp pilus-assembly TadE/G-like
MTRLQHLRRDERGMSFVFVGVGFLAFVAATTLAIDVGMFMTARSQAQTAADAGALAGATALVFDDFDDRSAGGPAVQSAINTALINDVMSSSVSVGPADVFFPLGPGGVSNRVRVNVYRTGGRFNPVPTLVGPVFGVPTVDINATATAEASPANAMTCVKPFTIPDRWTENTNPAWDTSDTYERYDKKGDVIPNADVYNPPGSAGYNGYDPNKDKGLPLMIRAGSGHQIEPTMYWSWKMPGDDIGADFYEENIAHCNTSVVGFGFLMTQEPGAMAGPTAHGIDALIAQDPDAFWDDVKNEVHSTRNPSPRIFPIPLYDPEYYAVGKASGRFADLRVANWLGFFVERRDGNSVFGRITPILGVIDEDAGPAPAGIFPQAIRLVE